MTRHSGFFGKLPARGDFVSAGLPRDFVSRWDAWICGVLPSALEAAGDGWLQAPVWRFHLPPGMCGTDAAAGLLFPSADKVGRLFPLTLTWLGDAPDDAAMALAEQLGRSAVAEAMPPDALAERLAAIPVGDGPRQLPPAPGEWSRADGTSMLLPALPDAATFATMISGRRHDR